MYESLTRLLPKFDGHEGYGEWIIDMKSKGTTDDPIQMPWVRYKENALELWQAIERFEDSHAEFDLASYRGILEKNEIDASQPMASIDVSELSGEAVLALFKAVLQRERFFEGLLLECCESGCAKRWLERLRELDGKEKRDCSRSRR